jgi:hypothetical protein
MSTKPLLQKILKGIPITETENNIAMKGWELKLHRKARN